MHLGASTFILPQTEAEKELERRRRIVAATAALILVSAVSVGGVALRGHVLYGDWRCGFRTCVVPPGWKRRR